MRIPWVVDKKGDLNRLRRSFLERLVTFPCQIGFDSSQTVRDGWGACPLHN